jgi:hypothetical protein
MDEQIAPKIQKVSFERILTWTFFLVIVTVVIITFFKYFITRDYIIQAEADCDPMTENCFIYECVPGVDEDCTDDPEDPEAKLSYYKIVDKKAYLIPGCDPNDENCDALNCQGMDKENCTETLCNGETKEEVSECVDPAAYSASHPEESEEGDEAGSEDATCAPDDENCVSGENLEEGSEETCAPDDKNCSSEESLEDSGGDGGAQEQNNDNSNSAGN